MFPFASRLNIAGWFHLVYFGVVIPWMVVRARTKFADAANPLPNRLCHFQSSALMIALFTSISIVVARVQWIDLFPRTVPTWSAIAAGIGLYAAAVAFMWPRWRRAVERRARIVHLFMPANAAERAWWIVVSFLAGIGEEITWRGVQTSLLGTLVGNYWIAAFLCAVSFGMAHFIQGWRSVVVIVFFGLGFQLLVWLDGTLYVAMAVHVVYDLTAGYMYGKLGHELGYQIEPPKPADNATTSDVG
jgi:membrane protease YdiL (CAAX protease family)